jgi:hypothetical protein
MNTRDLRNLLIVALAAALCFGGSFTCNTDSDSDDEIHGHVSVNAILW